ncbi:Uncharacterized protein QTN25_007898 [Entamoeba marina]
MSDVSISLNLPLGCTPKNENAICSCLFCRMKEVVFQNKYVPWITLARIFFLSLLALHPTKEYFSVKTDIPHFIQEHWCYLSTLEQFKEGSKWRKSMLDAINHSRYFESGKHIYHVSGYWKLKDLSVPFVENWLSSDLDIVEMSIKSDSSTDHPTYPLSNPVGSQNLCSYYYNVINHSNATLSHLYQLYPSTDPSLQQYIMNEITIHQNNIQRATETLYSLTETNNDKYSSYCLTTRALI